MRRVQLLLCVEHLGVARAPARVARDRGLERLLECLHLALLLPAQQCLLLSGNFRLHGIFNAYWEPLRFELPAAGEARAWRRWLDTSLESPEDILPWDEAPHIAESSYAAQPRSIAILVLPLPRERDWRRERRETT